MKRLSVTLLDSFRLYREADWFTLEMMIDRIMGKFEPTRQMDIGTAFHACVEHRSWSTEVNGAHYHFRQSDIEAFHDNLPASMIHEVKLVDVLEASEPVQVVGKVDGIYGNWICDHKTSFNAFSIDKYQDSYQWRYYLSMFGCDAFQYNFAQLKDAGEVVSVVNTHFLPLSRYPAMDDDVLRLTDEFLSFAKSQGLYSHLRESQMEKAA